MHAPSLTALASRTFGNGGRIARVLATSSLALASILTASPSRADDAPPAAAKPPLAPLMIEAKAPLMTPPSINMPDSVRRAPWNWYGWQTILATLPFDIAMFTGTAFYATPGGKGAFIGAFAGRNVVPAFVHLAHGRPGAALGSLGLHAASTAVGVAIGYGVGIAVESKCPPGAECRNGFRDMPLGPGYGAIAGSMLGTLLDTIFLGHKTPQKWTANREERSWAMAPYGSQGGFGLSASGKF